MGQQQWDGFHYTLGRHQGSKPRALPSQASGLLTEPRSPSLLLPALRGRLQEEAGEHFGQCLACRGWTGWPLEAPSGPSSLGLP